MTTERCLFCDDELESDKLVEHLWQVHIAGICCWCGATVYPSSFRRHLDAAGGPLAHYLEWQFRCKNG
jgi:hypothetical protein